MINYGISITDHIASLPQPIGYGDKILLTGSCFTEHIGNALRDWKFDTLQNPNGILFDPASVATSLISYIQPQRYTEERSGFFERAMAELAAP
jgi:hypothetical protein